MPEETQSQRKRSRAESARLPPRRLNLYNPPEANSSSFWLRDTEARGFAVVILAPSCILPLSKFFRFLCDSAHRAVGFCFGGDHDHCAFVAGRCNWIAGLFYGV